MLTASHKRGDTLSWGCAYAGPDGASINLENYTIRAQLRTAGGTLLGALTVANRSDPSGTFDLTASAATTAAWAPGLYVCDVELASAGGDVRSTETFSVRVVADVTRD